MVPSHEQRHHNLRQQCGPIRFGRDHIPNGRTLRMESATARKGFVRKFATGHRTARSGIATHTLVVGRVPEAETTAFAHGTGRINAKRLYGKHTVLDQSGVCNYQKWQDPETWKGLLR